MIEALLLSSLFLVGIVLGTCVAVSLIWVWENYQERRKAAIRKANDERWLPYRWVDGGHHPELPDAVEGQR